MSGGRTAAASELSKQVKGSQSSLDHLDSDGKVRRWRLGEVVALFPVVGLQDVPLFFFIDFSVLCSKLVSV